MKYLLVLAAGLALPLLAPAFSPPAQQDVAALLTEIKAQRDDVDAEKISALAEVGSRPAMEALLEAYEVMASIYMRLEVLRALARFDGVADAQQPAMQKIADVATSAPEPELRDGAVDALARCPEMGRDFLQLIVASNAEDDVREKAMRLHVQGFTEDDLPWYRELYEARAWLDRKKTKKKKKDEESEPDVYPLAAVRELALEKLAPHLEVSELVEAAKEKERDNTDLRKDGIRLLALEELARRGDKKAAKVAQDVYKDVMEKSKNRIAAARILYADKGDKIAPLFLEDGRKVITPLDLAYAQADILAEIDDPRTNKKLLKLVGKGKARDKLFVLRAVRQIQDEKLNQQVAELLADDDAEVRKTAARVLGERGATDALPQLEAVLETAQDELLLGIAVDAVSQIRAGDEGWQRQLEAYAASERSEIRNAAIYQLGKQGGHFDVLKRALEHRDWSTRFAALEGLEAAHSKQAVEAIVAAMPAQDGRLLHDFADALWRLTGQPYRVNAQAWKGWWERDRASFEPITAEELAQREAEEEARRLRQVSKASFFGIRIRSHRVAFVIDVSGSMNEETRTSRAGTARITVAKRELQTAIDALDMGSWFNIIPFSSDVSFWVDDVAHFDQSSREEAKEFVERLGAGGGTNLYGAIQAAFVDPDVDTIFVLSDGEPSTGRVIDPGEIREHVRQWNEHRKIQINTIAVGGRFQILEWIAEDSGGTHVEYP